jgi:hypothetical protein
VVRNPPISGKFQDTLSGFVNGFSPKSRSATMHGDLGPSAQLIAILSLLAVVIGPLALFVVGAMQREPAVETVKAPFDTALLVNSAITYALAFNVTFFIQELFLVIPKALTPGLTATLYHNNHSWTGGAAIANLYQGTGALAIFVSGLLFLILLRARPRGVLGLFVFWMAYHGLLMGLPQAPSAVIAPSTDVGDAFNYLQLSASAQIAIAVVSLLAMVAAGLALTGPFLRLADSPQRVATRGARRSFVLNAGVLPALIGVLLIAPFRWPGSAPSLVAPSILVAVFGLGWIFASAWMFTRVEANGRARRVSWIGVGALVVLLAIFQLVLRPGIAF